MLVFGVVIGNGVTRYVQRQHQHTRSVMTLAQFHLNRLEAAAQAGQCTGFELERARLRRVLDELQQAFPLSLEQDAEFRKRAEALRSALGATNAATNCASAGVEAKGIRDACDDCHREYR